MTQLNISTLNSPKHLVTLGRDAPKRMTRASYGDTWMRIHENLRRKMNLSGSYFAQVPCHQNRMNFGDIDIIVVREALPDTGWQQRMSTYVFDGGFNARVPGTDTWVFEYRGYQVNVHVVPRHRDLQRAVSYLAHGGIMTLVRILLKSLGVEYDINNFKLLTGIPNQPTLEIGYDAQLELRMAGISIDYFTFHVYSQEDVYQAVYTSQFFNRKVFLDMESQPGYAELVAKEPILGNFIAHLKKHPRIAGENRFDPESVRSRNEFTSYFKSYAPTVFSKYTEMVQKHRILEMTQAKFSVEKMAAVTGKEGDDLKKLMDCFAQDGFHDSKEFSLFILSSLPDTINARILALRDKMFKVETPAEAPAEAVVQSLVEIPALEVKVKPAKAVKKVTRTRKKTKTEIAAEAELTNLIAVEASDNSFALAG